MTPHALVFTGPQQPLLRRPQANLPLAHGSLSVRMLCCTLCASDVATFTGRRLEATPTVLGHEGVGVVESFGPGTPSTDAAGVSTGMGDRITWALMAACGHCFFCTHDLPQKCENGHKYGHHATTLDAPDGGGLADTLTLQPGTAWFRIPNVVSTPVASLANCAAATAMAVLDAAGPLDGRTIIVFGAGLLGLFACAIASHRGANVIAVDPDHDSRERAKLFGATAALAPMDPLPIEPRGADIALELAGRAETAARCVEAVRIGGTVVFAGTVSPTPAIPLDPQLVVRRMLTIRGIHNYHPRHLHQALDFLASRLFPFDTLIGASLPFEETEAAFAATERYRGRRVAVHFSTGGDE